MRTSNAVGHNLPRLLQSVVPAAPCPCPAHLHHKVAQAGALRDGDGVQLRDAVREAERGSASQTVTRTDQARPTTTHHGNTWRQDQDRLHLRTVAALYQHVDAKSVQCPNGPLAETRFS